MDQARGAPLDVLTSLDAGRQFPVPLQQAFIPESAYIDLCRIAEDTAVAREIYQAVAYGWCGQPDISHQPAVARFARLRKMKADAVVPGDVGGRFENRNDLVHRDLRIFRVQNARVNTNLREKLGYGKSPSLQVLDKLLGPNGAVKRIVVHDFWLQLG